MSDVPQVMAESELVDRMIYRVQSRNLSVGVWDARVGGFVGIREKFGSLFLDTEYQYRAQHGTARARHPLYVRVPAEIPLDEILRDANGDMLKNDEGYLVSNQALFDLLKPYDDEITEQWRIENEWMMADAASRKWRPQTHDEHVREVRYEAARAWRDKAMGPLKERKFEGLTDEEKERIKEIHQSYMRYFTGREELPS